MDTTRPPFGPSDRADGTKDESRNDDRRSWSTRFRRSSRDRKLAGVAGGIGRALDIDPVLIRVAFAVLSVFGGTGVALYALAWLLMPGERDEVSGLEALVGRGRSSVPTPLAIMLGIVVLGSFTSTVTWGLSLLPIAVGFLLIFLVVGKRQAKGRRHDHGSRHGGDGGGDWGTRAGGWGAQAGGWGAQAGEWGARAGEWGDEVGRRAQAWGEHVSREARSWSREQGDRSTRWSDPAAPQVDLTKTDHGPGHPAHHADGAADGGPMPAGSVTPPAWDPLGAAPFAWDLPEPGPAPASPQEQQRARRSRTTTAVVIGLALMVAGVGILGQVFSWWVLPLAAIAGAALTVVVLGVLFSAIGGRRSPLIGLGVVLAVGTAILTATGMTGHAGVGTREWAPTGIDTLAPSYSLDIGDATLDLRGVVVPAGQTAAVSVDLGLGDLTVRLPNGAAAQVGCTANIGTVTCLTEESDGFHSQVNTATTGAAKADRGTLDLKVHAGVGNVTVLVDG